MQTVSGLHQVGFAFNRIESALSYLVNHMGKFSGLAAQTERLDALFAGMQPAQNMRTTQRAAADVTWLRWVCEWLSTGAVLMRTTHPQDAMVACTCPDP